MFEHSDFSCRPRNSAGSIFERIVRFAIEKGHAFFLALAILPYFINLGGSSLWDSNEAFYAETPREMLESGDFVIPRFNYFFRWQKPPLAYWIVAASYRILGVSECSERLPIALLAAGWILLCYWAGCRWLSRNVALLAALMLSLNLRVFVLARRAITEIGLAFFVSMALLLLAVVLLEKPKRANLWAAAGYAALGMAVMTKGPVALVLVAGTVLGYAIGKRDLVILWRARPLWGMTILALLVIPWYWRVVDTVGWNPISNFFLSDNLGRYLTEEFGPTRGHFYYLGVLLSDLLPWSLLGLMAMLVMPLRQSCETRYRPFLVWLAIWFFIVLGFFSLSKNKQEYYIFPLYLPVNLMAAYALASVKELHRWRLRLTQAVFLSIGGALVAAGVAIMLLPLNLFQEMSRIQAIGFGLMIGGTGLGIIFLAAKRRWRSAIAMLVVAMWFVLCSLPLLFLPLWEAYKPVREFAALIQSKYQPGDYAGYYKYSAPSLGFYMKEPIFEIIWEDQIIYFLSTNPRRIFCVIQDDDWRAIQPYIKRKYFILAARPRINLKLSALFAPLSHSQVPQVFLISNSP